MPRIIDCFKKHNIPGLKDRYGSSIKDGMTDAEKLSIATNIALEHHKELHDELNAFKKEIGVQEDEYVSPSKDEAVKSIQDKFNKEIEAKKNKLTEENKKRESEKIVEAPNAVVSNNNTNTDQNGKGEKENQKREDVLTTPTAEEVGADTTSAPTLFIDGNKNNDTDIEDIVNELQADKIDINKENILSSIDENISTVRDILSNPNITKAQEKDAYNALEELNKLHKKVENGAEYKIQSEITTSKPKKENATQEGKKSESNKSEHKNGNGAREATKTSNSDSVEQSREKPTKEKEVVESKNEDNKKPTVVTNVQEFKKALKKAIPSLSKKQLEVLSIQAEQLKNFTVKEFGLSEEEAWKVTQGEIVKSLEELGIGNTFLMNVNGKQEMVRSMPDITNGFYSPIEKKILDLKQNNQSATKWLQTFGKGDEAVYTGVKEYLEKKRPNEQVTKQELLDYMKNNRVQIVEVVKGDFTYKGWVREGSSYFSKDRSYEIKDLGDNEFEVIKNGKYNLGSRDGLDNAKELAIENGFANEINLVSDTKFSQYQLEGEKENYKEVYIVIPREGVGKKVEDWRVPQAHLSWDELVDNRQIVRLRMSVRDGIDENGKKVKTLFIDEHQGDRGQQGKKEGFKETSFVVTSRNDYGLITDEFKTREEAQDFVNKIGRENVSTAGIREFNIGSTPQAPFVTNTNAWTKLGLKYAIQHAIKEGADRIAWTTGEQQIERYDLSKQVDDVIISKNKNGNYDITPKFKDGKTADYSNIPENKIEDYIGKELASKAIDDLKNSQIKKYSGLDLKVGGNGMIGFYGSPTEGKEGIVGSVAKALVKELTGQAVEIGETKIVLELKTKLTNQYILDTGIMVSKEEADKIIYDRKSKSQIYTFGDGEPYRITNGYELDNANAKNIYKVESVYQSTQHSIEITPELKASVEKGMPLFQKPKNESLNAKKQEQDGEVKGAANIQTQQTFYDKLADISTAIHEPHHHFLGLIDTLASQGNVKAIAMQRTINQWTESKEGKAFAEREGVEQNSPIHRQELFARSAEKYFMEGKRAGFSERMNKVFEAFKTFLKDIYKGVVNSPNKIQLSPEIRDLFDTIYGKEKTNEDLGKGTLSKREAIKEIKSKPLSIVKGLGMGMNSADGTYISTEPINRYATKENPGVEVKKVDIKNPLVVTNDAGLIGMRNELLNKNIASFTTEDFELGTKMNGTKYEDDLSPQGRSKLSTMVTDSLKEQGYDSVYFPQSDTQEGELIVFDKNAVTLGKQLVTPSQQAKKNATKPKSNNASGRKYIRENSDTSILGEQEPKGLFIQLLLNGRFLIKTESLKKLYSDKKTSSNFIENEEYTRRKWMTEDHFSNFRAQAKNTEVVSTDKAAEIIHSELGDRFSIQEVRNQIEEVIHGNESRTNYYATYEDMMEKAKGNEIENSEFRDEEIAEMLAHKQKINEALIQQAIEMNNENPLPLSDDVLEALYDKYVVDEQLTEEAFIQLPQNIINQLNQYVNEKANQFARANKGAEDKSNEDYPYSTPTKPGTEEDGIFFQKPGEKKSIKDLLKRVKEIKVELKDMKSEADLALDEIRNFKLIRGEDVEVQGVNTYTEKLGVPELADAYKKEFKQKLSLNEMIGLVGEFLAKGGKINEVAKLLGDEKLPLTNRVLIGSAIKGLAEAGFITKQTSDTIFAKYTKQLGTDVSEALNAFKGTDEAPSQVMQSLIYSAIGKDFEKELDNLNKTLDEVNNGVFKDNELSISEARVVELKNEVEVLKNKLAQQSPVVAETVSGTRRKKASDKLELIKGKLKSKYGEGFLKELSDKINKIKC